MRRLFVLACLTILVMLAPIAQSANITHLVYSWHGINYHNYLEEKAAEFEALYPGTTIDIVVGAHDKFDVMMAGGVPPDILDLPDYGHYAIEGIFVNLLPYLERDNLLGEYSPHIIDLMTAPDGGVYAMPLELGMITTIYNKDAFEQRGLATPTQLGGDWTWDTVLDFGKKFTVDRDGDGIPDEFGIDRPEAMWRQAVHQAGGRFYDSPWQPTKSLWNSEEVLAGFEFVREIFATGIAPNYEVPSPDQFHFSTGRTAINLVDGPGQIGGTLENVSFGLDLYLQPMGPGSRASAIGASGPYILASTENVDLAWEWVKYHAGTVENVQQWVSATVRIPAMTALQTAYADIAGISHLDYQYIFEQVQQPNPYAYTLPAELNPRRAPDMSPVWRGDVMPSAFLDNLHTRYSTIIEFLSGQ